MSHGLARDVERRLAALQGRHNFNPLVKLRLAPAPVWRAYGEFRTLCTLARKLGVRIPFDPRGKKPKARRIALQARPVHVYFARKGTTTVWKIGSSIDPYQRVRAVATGNDGPLHLVHVIKDVNGRVVERQLKKRLRRFKTRDRREIHKCEWFDMTAVHVKRIVRELRSKR